MIKKDVKKLLEKYSSGNCNEEEKALLESWYLQFKGKEFDLDSKELLLIKEYSWKKIIGTSKKTKRNPSWIQYAAAVLIFSLGLLFYFNSDTNQRPNEHEIAGDHDLTPGGNRATLTLDDGTAVSLDESANGIIAQVEGVKISKTADGQVVYEIINKNSINEGERSLRYNRITTPRGGQYQIILPDGTKVWLNAASSLRYPEQFSGNSRSVELLGEAYFEVNSQKAESGKLKPFIVSTSSQTVEVLGTHFNINSYEDEKNVKTTLIEGSVQVSSSSEVDSDKLEKLQKVRLKPNQQSILAETDLNVINVNGEESIAWKNGYFNFEQADLETVMRQLSRWYDVDVVYKGKIPPGTFTGKVYRNMNISKVFEILAFAQVNFKIAGKKVIIFS